MNKRRILLSILFVLSVVGMVFIGIYVAPSLSYAQQAHKGDGSVASPASNSFGLPAITPHVRNASSLTSGPNTFTPTYSIADAIQYVNTHPLPGASITETRPVIVKAAFLPSQEVSKLMKGESTGVPNGTLLCYVELRGTFTFYGGSGTAVTYHTGVEVFDAQTGNLLIAGGQ